MNVMHREILLSCWPLLTAMIVSLLALRVVWWLSGARLRLSHLRRLHRDQRGGVQSLSFVITLPLFMMILMFIVQLSQITIAKIVVEYSALAAARSAMVWIPANLGLDGERENLISNYRLVESTEGDDGLTYRVYEIDERSEKFDKIHFAAAMALMPICPSRDVGADQDHSGNRAAASLQAAYAAMSPATAGNRCATARHSIAKPIDCGSARVPFSHLDKLLTALVASNLVASLAISERDLPLGFVLGCPVFNCPFFN